MEKKIGHIKLARDNSHIIVYPATANIISKFAKGFCDDLALTCMIAANKPIYFAPAMNKEMWANPIIQNNVDYLKKIGHQFIGCLLYTSPSPRDMRRSRMPSSA